MIFNNSPHAHLRKIHLKITFILQPEVKQKFQNTDKTEIEKI